MSVHMMNTDDNEHPCTSCGFTSSSQVRGGPDPRLKCGRCNFVFSVEDSKAAKAAGAIPDGVPELQPETPKNNREPREKLEEARDEEVPAVASITAGNKIPRTPSFVVIAKDRQTMEFATKKTLRKIILKWVSLDKRYDVFELTPKTVSAKIDIS